MPPNKLPYDIEVSFRRPLREAFHHLACGLATHSFQVVVVSIPSVIPADGCLGKEKYQPYGWSWCGGDVDVTKVMWSSWCLAVSPVVLGGKRAHVPVKMRVVPRPQYGGR